MADRFAFAQQESAFDRGDSLAVIDALDELEASERELVVMRIWGGLKYEEIAEALAISISSAHRQYERALTKLRQILESPCSTNTNRQNLK
jgi:RNA polymerase sigma-70 factor (ECF subfamily)